MAKNKIPPFAGPETIKTLWKYIVSALPAWPRKTFGPWKSYGFPKTLKILGKLTIPTRRPCGLPQAALGVPCWPAQNRVGDHWKPLEKQTFLAVPAWWSTMAPAQALAPRRKSYGFRKSFKIVGKTNKSLTSDQAEKDYLFSGTLQKRWKT